ncbi:MAG: endo-1,4-beta-xylanase [Rhodothermales bacterium]
MRTLSPLLLLLILLASPAQGQDAYHSALLTQLETDHGITGGEWVFSENESITQDLVYDSGNLTRQSIAVAGQPFTTAMRLAIPQRGANPWDYFIGFTAQKALAAGDKALMVVWIRGIDAERASGLVNANFEQNSNPYTKSLFRGLIPSSAWQQWIIPFEASIAHGTNQAQAIFHLGIMAQSVEFAGLAVINYGNKYTLDQLPSSSQELDYTGRSASASWRAEADARIDTYRKRDLLVNVVDNRGQAVENASVSVEMQRHRFGFGSAVAVWMMLQQSSDGAMYRSKIADLNGNGQRFSTSVLENGLKWGIWENPDWPGNQTQTIGVVEDLINLGMDVRGHNLVWPSWDFMPAEALQLQNDPAALRLLIEARITDVGGRSGLKGALIDWDVLNEPAHLTDVAEVFAQEANYATGEEVYAEWFKQAAEVDPEATLYINEYGILTNSGLDLSIQERYQEIIEVIETNGGRIDGVGMQGHFSLPLTPPEVVYEIFDQYAASGKELSVTEYDAENVPEDLAADYMRDLLTITFSHPAMRSFLMWGFWDGAHWKNDAPIFRQDWSLKPSGQAFFDLVFDEWWTNEQAVTNADGEFMLRGFHGMHEITVDFEGTVVRTVVDLEPGEGPTEVSIALPRQVSIGEDMHAPDRFELMPHYPEPASGQATLRFALPAPSNVRINVFDTLGRQVDSIEAEQKPAGKHEVILDTAQLTNGVYFYSIQAGEWNGRRSFVVRK